MFDLKDEDMDKSDGGSMMTSGGLAPVTSVAPLSPAVKSQSTLSHLLQQQNGNINLVSGNL